MSVVEQAGQYGRFGVTQERTELGGIAVECEADITDLARQIVQQAAELAFDERGQALRVRHQRVDQAHELTDRVVPLGLREALERRGELAAYLLDPYLGLADILRRSLHMGRQGARAARLERLQGTRSRQRHAHRVQAVRRGADDRLGGVAKRGGGVTGRLRQGLGVDSLDLGTEDDGTAKVGVGAYLADGLYADAAVNAKGETEVTLNLDLTDTLTLKGSVDSEGETGIGLFFEKDY